MHSLKEELSATTYPGRGIILGNSADGRHAVIAYFIMGRSENSRNRVFVADGDGLKTKAFDESKMVDPSLIIYAPVRVLDGKTIVTNGDQTDTVYELMQQGKTFEDALRTRTFEPDGPNFTPRISGLVEPSERRYRLSILKSADGRPESVRRFFFDFDQPFAGEERGILFIPISRTAIRCLLSSGNRRRWRSRRIWTRLPKRCGKASMRITAFRCSPGLSTGKPARRRPVSSIKTCDNRFSERNGSHGKRIAAQIRMQPEPEAVPHLYAGWPGVAD